MGKGVSEYLEVMCDARGWVYVNAPWLFNVFVEKVVVYVTKKMRNGTMMRYKEEPA